MSTERKGITEKRLCDGAVIEYHIEKGAPPAKLGHMQWNGDANGTGNFRRPGGRKLGGWSELFKIDDGFYLEMDVWISKRQPDDSYIMRTVDWAKYDESQRDKVVNVMQVGEGASL
jgi:hypothetical protein